MLKPTIREVKVVPGEYFREAPSAIHLVKGRYIENPHPRALCPALMRWGLRSCYRKIRPKFTARNHANPNLELWFCMGSVKCSNFREEFLIKVDKTAT